MNTGFPVKRELGWCPARKPSRGAETFTFHGPFRYVTACLEKNGAARNRLCLMFVTGTRVIVTPVPRARLPAAPAEGNDGGEIKPAQPPQRRGLPLDRDSAMLAQLDRFVERSRAAGPDEVFVAEEGADAIGLDAVQEIVITRVRGGSRNVRLLSFFSMFPSEPANARYHVNYQLAIATGTRRRVVVTPFSLELKETLCDLLGDRVREIPDEYAPLL
jgi:hypothetical protein